MNQIYFRALRWFKYRYARTYLKLPKLERSLNLLELNDEQISGLQLVRLLAHNPTSEILMAPISDRYYLRNGEIFIVIDINRISIINSIYHYDIYVSETLGNYLIRFLRKVIEKRRIRMEREMKSKITKSLSIIVNEIQAEFNKKGEV